MAPKTPKLVYTVTTEEEAHLFYKYRIIKELFDYNDGIQEEVKHFLGKQMQDILLSLNITEYDIYNSVIL